MSSVVARIGPRRGRLRDAVVSVVRWFYPRPVQIIEVVASRLDAFGSHGVTTNHPIDPVSGDASPMLLRSAGPAHVVTAVLESGGKIGRHPATGTQLLVVVSGELRLSGDHNKVVKLHAGQAVLFEPGEQHESVAETGATLAIMEFKHHQE